MNWEQILEEINSPELDAALNVASSMDGFFRAAREHPTVQEAYSQMMKGDRLEDVMGSIYDLSTQPPEPGYENPNDTALAILLWLTSCTSPDNAQTAAEYVSRAEQCWYARKLSHRILLHLPSPPIRFVSRTGIEDNPIKYVRPESRVFRPVLTWEKELRSTFMSFPLSPSSLTKEDSNEV